MNKFKLGKIASLFLMLIVAVSLFGFNSQKAYASNDWEQVGSNIGGVDAEYTDIDFNPLTNLPYAVNQSSTGKAKAYEYDGSSWSLLGGVELSTGWAENTTIKFNHATNKPYVAFVDNDNGGKITVMRYDGANWVGVGTPGFSPIVVSTGYKAGRIAMAFDPITNEPYVAFIDNVNEGPNVMKYDGANWVYVGIPDFAPRARYINLEFNTITHKPYVAFQSQPGYMAFVMKYNGSAWVDVDDRYSGGIIGVHPLNSNLNIPLSLNLDSTGIPYIACIEKDTQKANVMKYDGDWINVGSTGFSSGVINDISLDIKPSTNELYVAYSDATNSDKTTAKIFNGSSWSTVGTGGFSTYQSLGNKIVFNGLGIPYIAFQSSISGTTTGTIMKFNYGTVATPVASHAGGTYTSSQSVTLSTTTSGADIYYTTNGDTPTASSTHYTGEITISSSKTIKVIAIKSGMVDSDVMSEAYIITPSSPMYRFLNKKTGEHFFSIDSGEKDAIIANLSDTWTYEGIAYYAFASSQSNTSPMYRFLNKKTGEHFFSIDSGEKDAIIANLSDTWTYEGIAYYAFASSQSNTSPMYRFLNKKTGEHFFSIDSGEKDAIIANLSDTWTYEGIAYYAFASQ